ncbi:hypothetical protein ACTOB_003716 [Actinoplanes oblitus]|uniref:DUF2768 domain-containing protein n=1 Tax=Actinoplanes oblitus TaxID=3040509 RepID=A0ABY8WQ65_9ACTN|nr:hypothetical protein [Actinoplanes oblitus]WIN00040.1 hypothetical protein ACTOB_003716 [Actinoplanes oblitus]
MNGENIGLWLAVAITMSAVFGLGAAVLMVWLKQTKVKAVIVAGGTFGAVMTLSVLIFTLLVMVNSM